MDDQTEILHPTDNKAGGAVDRQVSIVRGESLSVRRGASPETGHDLT